MYIKLVRLKGVDLNQLFDVLADWNRNLKGCFAELEDSEDDPDPSPDIEPD